MGAENKVQLVIEVTDKGSAKVSTFASTLTDQVKKASEAMAPAAASMSKLDAAVKGTSGTVERGAQAMQGLAKGAGAAKSAAAEIEAAWKKLGLASTASAQKQKQEIVAAYETIKKSAGASQRDIVRAEQAKSSALTELNRKQLLEQRSLTEESAGTTGKTSSAVMRLIAKLGGLVIAWQAVKSAVRSAMAYLGQIETATLGIAAAFMTGGKYIDATSGKALTAQAALQAAQADSAKLVKELQYANLQTIATLDQLIIAYQQTLPVALAKGFDVRQAKEFTVAMVQAAGAIGLPMDQLGEETRSLLTENINPRNSRIATVLGLRNEDVAAYKNNAAGLFDFLMEKLAAYKLAGSEAQNTWAGLWSNTKDIFRQFLGDATQPLFEAVKYELQGLISHIVTLDEKTKTIKWNPEFTSVTESIRNGISAVIAEFYRLGMLADKVGGSLTRFLSWTPLAVVPSWAEGLHKRNEAWLQRYDASNKALSDMGMRAAGWKPMTPDMDTQIREAVLQGKKIADQTWINIGGDGDGTQQLLRYYRPIEQDTTYQPQQKQDEEARVSLAKASLESLKKINKDYFQDQENNLRFLTEATKSFSTANYLAEKDALEKRSALAAEYYARTAAEISLEAQARSQEERSKLTDAQFVAERTMALDAEAAAKKRELGRQQILFTLQVAEADKQALTGRLQEYQNFYSSLQGMIQKNAEEQKQKIEELNALYRQQASLTQSTAAQVRGLQEIGMSPTQKYASQKSALDDQYMNAIKQSGQEQIKALEEYKQAAASFGQTWSGGVTEITKNWLSGDKTSVIASGKDIINSVISNIEAAATRQKQTLADLAAEKEKQIKADQAWGDVLKQSAAEAVASIQSLKGVIAELESQIANMQKVVTITGDDKVSRVVNDISIALAGLHDKVVNITTIYHSIGGAGGELILPSQTAAASGSSAPIASYATGTPYVPRTGLYRLHQGEIVVPEEESRQIRQRAVLRGRSVERYREMVRSSAYLPMPPAPAAAPAPRASESRTVQVGDIHIHIPESAAPQRPEDWRYIVRTFVKPELEKIGHA